MNYLPFLIELTLFVFVLVTLIPVLVLYLRFHRQGYYDFREIVFKEALRYRKQLMDKGYSDEKASLAFYDRYTPRLSPLYVLGFLQGKVLIRQTIECAAFHSLQDIDNLVETFRP